MPKKDACHLNDDLAWEWMMEDLSDERIMEIALTQCSATEMVAHTVSPQFKGALDPTEPYDFAELPPLAALVYASF